MSKSSHIISAEVGHLLSEWSVQETHPTIACANMGNAHRVVRNSTEAHMHPTNLEELLQSLNSEVDPLSKKDDNDSNDLELKKLSSETRMNTGVALRVVHEYQTEQSTSSLRLDNVMTTSGDDVDPQNSPGIGSQGNETVLDSRPSSRIPTSNHDQQSRAREPEEPPASKSRFKVRYSRILLGAYSFQVVFQVFFALALGEVFGYGGFHFAAIFLVLLLAISVTVIVDGVRQRMLQIKEETREGS